MVENRLLRRLEAVIGEEQLLLRGAGVVLACSGGADSLALAHMFCQLREAWGFRLCMAHFDHGIRGEASRVDAAFVERTAAAWGIPFRLGRGDVPAYARHCRLSVETAARELRYRFLEELCDELGYDAIVLAHHGDDQAETVLMRILRGTGLAGLSAMGMREGRRVRPLLGIWKEELLAYCEEAGLSPREDATNTMPVALRNRIRLELLPHLRAEYNPLISEALCRLGRWAEDAQDFLRCEWERLRPGMTRQGPYGPELSRDSFLELHPALRHTALRAYLREVLGDLRDLCFVHFASVERLLLRGCTGAGAELPHGQGVELSYGWLRPARCMEQALPEVSLAVPGWTELEAYGGRMYAEIRRNCPGHTGPMEYYCDYDRLPEPKALVIRTRHPGDRIAGLGGTKKLKDFFIDCKIPREQRDRQPLLVCGGCILWVVGRKRSRMFRPQGERILYLRAEGFGFIERGKELPL